MEKVNVAVAGATGAVGEAMREVLEERGFPVGRLVLLASPRSAGKRLQYCGKSHRVEVLEDFDFEDIQIGLFSAGGSVSEEHAPRAAAAGAVVIDNTSRFRYDDDVPLIVPEVNPDYIDGYSARGIIANPNCSTIQMVVALKPINDAVGIERVNVSTYQSVSGAGRLSMELLTTQSRSLLNGGEVPPQTNREKPVAFNAVPKIDRLMDNGYTKEEMKMVWETRKILEDPDILVNPTCVRVPVYLGHSEALHIETREKLTVDEVRDLLDAAPGVVVVDGEKPGDYPTAATEAANRDAVYVGRIREDISHPRGINLWVVADNLRKGAALNSVQIAEVLVDRYL